ncbi:MAG: hypothetical protein CMF31_06580 [Kordiimonas sp.]|nr:hypothetical protein [Kordiimonas sp.]
MPQLTRQTPRPLSHKLRRKAKDVIHGARYGSRLYDYQLRGRHPLRLLGTLQDPWPGNVVAGQHILVGRFFAAGHLLKNPQSDTGQWPTDQLWTSPDMPARWWPFLHSFAWLRDLDEVGDRKAVRKCAEALVKSWLSAYDQWHEEAWRPDVLGQRITFWLSHAPLILDTNDLVYRSAVINALARQSRHLARCVHLLPSSPVLPLALIGLCFAGLFLPHGEAWLQRGQVLLARALKEQILTDGGVLSRSPLDQHQIYKGLVALQRAYEDRGLEPPAFLAQTLTDMLPFLMGMTHGDGRLALFNGGVVLDETPIKEIIKVADAIAAPLMSAEQSGFQRLERGGVTLIMDCGPPAPHDISEHSHAGTLSFELSTASERIIVNCGAVPSFADDPRGELNRMSRSTAAHSSLVINNRNSSELLESGLIGEGPTIVTSSRHEQDGHLLVEASHNGYDGRYGLIHHRRLYMSADGHDIRGEDRLERQKMSAGQPRLPYDLRFHLHPEVVATLHSGKDMVTLRLPSGQEWSFRARGGEMAVEESLYFGDGAPYQRALQIMVTGYVDGEDVALQWSFVRQDQD